MTRVLVIDDEPSILRALRINLTARNYEVSTAGDGASGLLAVSRERPDAVILDVIDHGCGVPAELKERIFEPFARLDERTPGVGLGLAVAKGFAEAMGGSIVAIDTPRGGLTVRVTMPALTSDVPAALGADQ